MKCSNINGCSAFYNNLMKGENVMTMKTKKRILVFSKPTAVEAIRETFVARYPNGKIDNGGT